MSLMAAGAAAWRRRHSVDPPPPPVGEDVAFVAASANSYGTGTSHNATIPAGAEVGDLLLAWFMRRSAGTPPAGWFPEASVECEGTGSTVQRLDLYSRVCQIGDPGASTTWGQSSSERISVHIQAFRGDGFTPVVLRWRTLAQSLVTANAVAMASVSSTVNGRMAAMGGTTVTVGGVSPATVAASVGTLTSTASVAENRMAAAYLARNAGEAVAGNFTWGFTATTNGVASITALLGSPPADYNPNRIPSLGNNWTRRDYLYELLPSPSPVPDGWQPIDYV